MLLILTQYWGLKREIIMDMQSYMGCESQDRASHMYKFSNISLFKLTPLTKVAIKCTLNTSYTMLCTHAPYTN